MAESVHSNDFNDLEELGIDCTTTKAGESFNAAANHLATISSKLDSNTLLKFYALYKQTTEGACRMPKPSWYDIKAKSKWEAWSALKDMSKDEAESKYVDLLKEIDSEFTGTGTNAIIDFGTKVSTFDKQNCDEPKHERDKTVFDYVKEGNCDRVGTLLKSMKNVNVLDSNGLGLIHWAADRGYARMLQLLVKLGVNIDLQDDNGQTALHYASSCGHAECCETLLKNGANVRTTDSDGSNAVDVAEDDIIRDLLQRHLETPL